MAPSKAPLQFCQYFGKAPMRELHQAGLVLVSVEVPLVHALTVCNDHLVNPWQSNLACWELPKMRPVISVPG